MDDENKALPTVETLADIATDEDKLFRDGYVKGASKFIKECATPMTIAVQGNAGTGKTSLFNLIEMGLRAEPELEEDDDPDERWYCEDIIGVATIDVGQQSVANPDAKPFDILFLAVLSKITGYDSSAADTVSGIASVASQVVGMVASDNGNNEDAEGAEDDSILGSIFGALFNSEDDSKSEPKDNFIRSEDIDAFQSALVETLQQSAEDNDKSADSRFVVFVDGLDRISPEAVVDLLGRIKIYLECPRCVYVIAVDEKMVFDGVKKKLGDKVEEERKKLFYDTLIQVPLRIPTSAYNLNKYVEDFLRGEKELSDEFVKVINTLLIEPTPRLIKRCINTTHLYWSVFGASKSADDGSLAMLFAAVIVKDASDQGFNAIANCAQGDEAHFAENLKATLASSDFNNGINWALLPALWGGEEGANVDAAKRSAFLSWVRKLR